MSGHSKWHQIKHKKAVTDSKKGQLFGRLARDIAQAARVGSDPALNPALRDAVLRAKQANMPQANIDRLLQRSGEKLRDEHVYEGFGPNGVALLIVAATDSPNRTVAELRTLLRDHEGSLGTPGSVRWKFTPMEELRVSVPETNDLDAVVLAAIEAGATDVTADQRHLAITVLPSAHTTLAEVLTRAGIAIDSATTNYHIAPELLQHLSPAAEQSLAALLVALRQRDDIVAVFTDALL